MTCDECERIQDGGAADGVCFVRIDKANVMVVGCREHLKILIERLREK